MSTADEMNLKRLTAEAKLAPLLLTMGDTMADIKREAWSVFTRLLWEVGSRPCHAARARKLRRRGMDVRFDGRTSTGKARYRWAKPLPKVAKC